jgi:hypothetical protein
MSFDMAGWGMANATGTRPIVRAVSITVVALASAASHAAEVKVGMAISVEGDGFVLHPVVPHPMQNPTTVESHGPAKASFQDMPASLTATADASEESLVAWTPGTIAPTPGPGAIERRRSAILDAAPAGAPRRRPTCSTARPRNRNARRSISVSMPTT